MIFNRYEFRKQIIARLKNKRQHFADISDIVSDFISSDIDLKIEVERELVHLTRNMQILDVKELELNTGKMNDDWIGVLKKFNVMTGDKLEGLYASLTPSYFANQRQKRMYYIGIGVAVCALLFWAVDKMLTRPS
jgi:hypothetical protein